MKLTSKVYWLSFFLITLNSKFVFSQNSTGINNPNPSTKAALDIQTSAGFKQGFFMPRLVGADTTAIGATIGKDRGLMFFDTLIGDVRFWDGAKWKGGGSASTVNYWQTNGNTMVAADTALTGYKYIGTNNDFPLIFATKSIQRMRISKAGNVGIGKTPSDGIPLQVKSNGTGTILQLEQEEPAKTPLFEFKQNPNKNARFQMYDMDGNPTIEINAESGTSSYINAGNFGIGNTSPSVSLDLSSRTDAIAIPVGKTSDQPTTAYKGMIRYNSENNWFEGHDGNTWNAFNTGSGTPSWNITGNVGTTSTSNFLGTRDKISLRFKTNDTEYMVIDSTGKIGIGTKTPSDNLEVVSNIRLRHPNNTSTKWGIEASQVGGLQIIDRINNQRKMIFNDNGDIYLGAVPINIAGASSAMAILKAGNIGIGTLTPLSKLDINGAVAIGASAGVKAAPANGLLVSGNVGLGTDSADVRLLVKYHALGDGSQATLRIYQHNCGSACGQKNGSAIQLINDNQTGPDQGAVLSFADPINVTNKDDGAASIALVNRNSTLGQGGLAFRTRNSAGVMAERIRISAEGLVGIGVSSPAVSLDLSSRTDAITVPRGVSAQQPASPSAGMIRFNTSNNTFEGHNGTTWNSFSTGTSSPWSQSGTTISNATGTSQVNINYTGQVGLQLNGTNTSWSSLYMNGVIGANIGFGYNRAGIFKGGTYLNASDDWTVQLWDGTVTKTRLYVQSSTGNVGIGTTTPIVSLDLSAKTDAINLPKGTSTQRPTAANAVAGAMRYNTDLGMPEYFDGTNWHSLVPAGTIVAYGGTTAPAGWLLCNGATYSQATYPALYAAIGTAFGSNALTTFNVPDFRGRFLRGVSSVVAQDPDRATRTAMATGGNTGALVGSVQADAFGSHTHTVTDPGHNHNNYANNTTTTPTVATLTTGQYVSKIHDPGGGIYRAYGMNGTGTTPTVGLDSNELTGITNQTTGGTETRPKNAYVNYIIKY